jgi:hypothetical protein
MAVLGALGDLVLALSADTAKFQSDLGRAQRVADKFGREVGRAIGNVAGALLALGGTAGFAGLVKGQIDAADAAGKMSQKIGVSTEALSAYMVAAQLSDVSNEQLQTGFQQLAKNQADFVAGTGEAADAFRALGISQAEVKALNGDNAKLFDLVAGKLASFEDGANKTALAMKIFGRSGPELIPLINGLEETRKKAEQLNAIIDKDTSEAANRFNDNLTMVGISVRAMGLNVAKAVLPTLEKLSEKLLGAAKDTQAMGNAGKIADAGLKLLVTGGMAIATVFEVAGKNIGAVAAAFMQAAQGNFREAWAIVTARSGDAVGEVTGAVKSIGALWDQTANEVAGKADATGRKLAAPALVSAEQVKKAMAQAMKDAEKLLELQEMGDADTLGASEALKNQDIKNAREREDALEAVTRAQVESAQIATELAEEMVYTWDEAGNRIEMTREQFDEVGKQTKKSTEWARDLGVTFTSAFEDAVAGGKGLSEILKGLEQDIVRIITRKLVTEPLGNAVTDMVKGAGGASGIFDSVGKFFSGLIGGGTGLAEGTDFVPRDGLALLHKGEAVVPAKENGGRRDSPLVINFHGVTDAGSFRANRSQIGADIASAVARARREL